MNGAQKTNRQRPASLQRQPIDQRGAKHAMAAMWIIRIMIRRVRGRTHAT